MPAVRTLAALALAGGLSIALAPAASAVEPGPCPHDESTRLFTANDGDYKVWVYQDGDRVFVCTAVAGAVANNTEVDPSRLPL
jgi:hypothetical protein